MRAPVYVKHRGDLNLSNNGSIRGMATNSDLLPPNPSHSRLEVLDGNIFLGGTSTFSFDTIDDPQPLPYTWEGVVSALDGRILGDFSLVTFVGGAGFLTRVPYGKRGTRLDATRTV